MKPSGRPAVAAQESFRRHRESLEAKPLDERFQYIYDHNLWNCEETRSGVGSTLDETEVLRREIPALLHELGARSLLDIPCGDFRWMSEVDLSGIDYTGADIVDQIVEANRSRFGKHFVRLDLTADVLPAADVVLCRDCLVHLSYANIRRALENVKRSGARWLLTTSFLDSSHANTDIPDGDWRALNFELAPFCFPKPERVIVEDCKEGDGAFADKGLCLWPVELLK